MDSDIPLWLASICAREYWASLMDLPDLPQKVYIRQPNGSLDALLHGVVANPGPMNVEAQPTDGDIPPPPMAPPPDGGSVYITQLTSTVDVVGRLPLNPMEKEGYNYSLDLQGLAREVQPLRTRVPCPRDYRRTSAELLFRRRSFISDWCHFSLVTDEVQVTEPNQFQPMVVQDTFHLRQLSFEPRNNFADFVLSLLVPGFLLAVLLGLLGTAMCRRAFNG
ncbi:SGCE [Cordylochernes scorpioides]|uniref:SGCE n=1 Tax=Cordylochernes scorpioides TaxID=51811 RepID=A0ABY6KLW3_9ARAC|nr:SGCE [Cordylochernes scorpioides]